MNDLTLYWFEKKSEEQEMKKEAMAGWLTAPLMHVLGNRFTSFGLKNPKFQKHLLDKTFQGNMGAPTGLGAEALTASAKGFVPELSMMGDQFYGLGQKLKNQGVSLPNINKRDLAQARSMLLGRFERIRDLQNSPLSMSIAQEMKQRGFDIEDMLKQNINMEDIKKIYNEGEITGKLFKGIGKQIGNYTPRETGMTNMRNINLLQNTGEALGHGYSLMSGDIFTPIMNLSKRVAASSSGAKSLPLIESAKQKLRQKMFYNPISKAFTSGYKNPNQQKNYELFKTFINPITGDAMATANKTGRFLANNPKVQNNANKARELSAKAKQETAEAQRTFMKLKHESNLAKMDIDDFTQKAKGDLSRLKYKLRGYHEMKD